MKTVRSSGFTLIELLVVIAILGILAALSVPALKNLGKGNVQASASRQLLDDIGRGRQLAISDHTTVYMVFLTTNFWVNPAQNWPTTLNATELAAVTNLLDKQLSGYNFIAYGALGDQPGQHQWHYLDKWQALPQGFIIAPWKFSYPTQPFTFTDPINVNANFSINLFPYANNIPFPLVDSNLLLQAGNGGLPFVPYIEFNYQGGLVLPPSPFVPDRDATGSGLDIPLEQASVSYPLDSATKIPYIPPTPLQPNVIGESPLGSSTNVDYNVVHIDALTGRATLLYHQVQ